MWHETADERDLFVSLPFVYGFQHSFYLFQRQRVRGRKVTREEEGHGGERIYYLLVHSPNGYNDWGQARSKVGAWTSIWASHVGGKSHLLLLIQMYHQGGGLEVEQLGIMTPI